MVECVDSTGLSKLVDLLGEEAGPGEMCTLSVGESVDSFSSESVQSLSIWQ